MSVANFLVNSPRRVVRLRLSERASVGVGAHVPRTGGRSSGHGAGAHAAHTQARALAYPHQARVHSTSRLTSVLPPVIFSCSVLSSAPHLQTSSSNPHTNRPYSSNNMASEFSKTTLEQGDGKNYPKKGDTVTMEYTGWLYEPSAEDNKGSQFDSSVGRGDFKTPIGTGRVIKGWDEGVPQMSVGEKARLIIPGDWAYGARGFPGLIPPHATLMFEVRLKKIN